MAIAPTEYTPFSSLTVSGVITTDTFNTWRKKTNGLIVLLDGTAVGGGLSSSNLSTGAPSWTSGGSTSIFGGSDVLSNDALTISANSTGSGLIITQKSTGPALRVNDVASDTSPFIVDADGNLIVGSAYTLSFNNRAEGTTTSRIPHIAAIGAGAANGAAISIFQTNNDAYGGVLSFVKSRGTASSASQTIAVQDDSLGIIDWQGQATTSAVLTAAAIEAKINASATISSTSMPGYLTFSTNPGNALAERMRIDSAGLVGIGKTTPTVALDVNGAITASGTVTGATLTNGTVTITGSTISGVTGFTASAGGDIVTGGKLKGNTLEVGSTAQLTVTAAGVLSTSGAVTGVGLAAGSGAITGASLSVSGAIGGTSCVINGPVTGQSFVVIGGAGAITTTGTVTAGSFNASGGGISNAGAIGGASTISATGAVTAGSFNASGGGILNAGAIGGASTIGATGAITSGANSTGAGGLITSTRDTQNGYASAALISQSYIGDAGLSLLAQGSCAVFLKCERTTGTLHIHTHATSPATTYANVILNQLDAKGDIIAFSTSDRKYKDNIANITNPLDKVAKINGVSFDWNDQQSTFTGRDIGVIAQEVEAVLPEVVTTRDDGTKAVKYDKMVALLIECVKELKAEIEELKSKVN